MTTQPNVAPDYAGARERFAEALTKVSAPQPAAPQREPNAELAARAKQMQAATGPDGKRLHSPQEVHAAWAAAFSTPTSAGTVGSTDPRVHPGTGTVAKAGHHFAKVTFGNGRPGIIEVPDGHRFEIYSADGQQRSRFVPDANAYRGPETRTAEPDGFSRQSAERVAELGPERAAQEQWLNEFAAKVDPQTGKRYVDNPAVREKIESARARLYDGEDISGLIEATTAKLADSAYVPHVSIEGYATIHAPPGFELDHAEVARHAKAARAAGISPEQFQALVTAHVTGATYE